jgi:DNA polymerase-3 subunit delta
MWGDRRLVIVDNADKFVTQFRDGLEKYLTHPARKSVLVLDVKTWPKTTRLAKAVVKIGLEVECSSLSGAELLRWLSETARAAHGKALARDAAALICDLAGDDLSLLEQELAKLAAYVGTCSTIEADDVRTLVGGWRTETTWAIAGAIRRGKTGEALDLLDGLLNAGESAHKTVAGLTFVFRRLAQAVERVREGAPLDAAVRDVGVFPREVGESSAYLKRLGRSEAQRLFSRLLEADVNLKGGLTIIERQILETLVVNLGGTSALLRRT